MVQKMPSFFFSWAPTHHSFIFNLRFLYEMWHKVDLSKTCVRISYLIPFRLNAWTLWLKKGHNSFQNENNRKATHSFVPRPLIFKLQQEVLKFNDIYAHCSLRHVRRNFLLKDFSLKILYRKFNSLLRNVVKWSDAL